MAHHGTGPRPAAALQPTCERAIPGYSAQSNFDVRRFALHTSESLKARLEDPTATLLSMATHRGASEA